MLEIGGETGVNVPTPFLPAQRVATARTPAVTVLDVIIFIL